MKYALILWQVKLDFECLYWWGQYKIIKGSAVLKV